MVLERSWPQAASISSTMFLTDHTVDSVFLESIIESHHALFGTAAVLVMLANGVVRNEIDIRQFLNVLEAAQPVPWPALPYH